LRVAIAGLGKMGGNHLRVLTQMKSVKVVGFYDPNVENDRVIPFTHFSSMQELLNSKPDYVVIATPTSSHLEIVKE
jgi:predicted dehydrogenase